MPSGTTIDTQDGDALWTITRKSGGVQHQRQIPERLLDPALLLRLKELVRA